MSRGKYLEERSIFHFPLNTQEKRNNSARDCGIDESPEINGIVEPSNLKRFDKWAKEKTVLYISSDDFAIAAQFQFFFLLFGSFSVLSSIREMSRGGKGQQKKGF